MNNSSSNKSNHGWPYSVISLVLGISGAVLPIVLWIISDKWWGWREVFGITIYGAVAGLIVGIIFGVQGKNTTRREMAITGIVICSICLFFWVVIVGWLVFITAWGT